MVVLDEEGFLRPNWIALINSAIRTIQAYPPDAGQRRALRRYLQSQEWEQACLADHEVNSVQEALLNVADETSMQHYMFFGPRRDNPPVYCP